MHRFLLPISLACVCCSSTCGGEDIFGQFADIYVAAFEGVMHDHKPDDRVLTVAMAITDDASLTRMPDCLWNRLKKRLEAKGKDLSRFVSADDVVWKRDSRFIHKPSGKEAWVYTISGINWYGTNRLHVSQFRSNGHLPDGRSTVVLGKRNEQWVIMDGMGMRIPDRGKEGTSTSAAGDIFADLEEIYLTVFEDIVRDDEQTNRVLAVAMAIEDNHNLIGVPDRLWKRLKKKLEGKGKNLSKFISASEIIWSDKDLMYIQKSTGKDAWIYTMSGIEWHGTNRLYVSECVVHGNLAAGGSTLVLVKTNAMWTITDRIGSWVSTGENGRHIFDRREESFLRTVCLEAEACVTSWRFPTFQTKKIRAVVGRYR